jgi:hypothetical protein
MRPAPVVSCSNNRSHFCCVLKNADPTPFLRFGPLNQATELVVLTLSGSTGRCVSKIGPDRTCPIYLTNSTHSASYNMQSHGLFHASMPQTVPLDRVEPLDLVNFYASRILIRALPVITMCESIDALLWIKMMQQQIVVPTLVTFAHHDARFSDAPHWIRVVSHSGCQAVPETSSIGCFEVHRYIRRVCALDLLNGQRRLRHAFKYVKSRREFTLGKAIS